MAKMCSICLNDSTVDVEFTYIPGLPATFDDPPEPAEIELDEVIFEGIDILPVMNPIDIDLIIEKIERLSNY